MNDVQPVFKIAIIEDDQLTRSYFSEVLSASDQLKVSIAIGLCDELPRTFSFAPDIYLVDIGLPDGSGLDLIPLIKAASKAKVLVITSFGDRNTVVSAIEAGADGYLLKDSDPDFIVGGVFATLDGGAPVSAAAAVYLLDHLRAPGKTRPSPTESDLTNREIELLQCFVRGQSYKEAARELGISPLTVGNHVKSIYRKLAVHSRGEAVYEAVRRGDLKF